MRAEGEGEAALLLHGLPSSSFLYRKVIHELAERGLAAMSFDLPGLGLADRTSGLDYTFAGLSRFAAATVDEFALDRLHLVIHNTGGPDWVRTENPDAGAGELAHDSQHRGDHGWDPATDEGVRPRSASDGSSTTESAPCSTPAHPTRPVCR